MKRNSANDNQSTVQREAIDPVFKEVLTFRFGQLDIPVQTQVEISRIPRTMDALIFCKRPGDLEKIQSETPFGHFRVYNDLEFKSIKDALTIAEYRLILGRANLYLGENHIPASEMTVTIVCARKPRKVLYHSSMEVEFENIGNGHYVSTDKLPVHIIVINELEVSAKNYPLLLFASSEQKFRQFLRQTLDEGNLIYVRFAYYVRSQVTKEVLAMAGKYRLPKKNLEFIAKDIGTELLPFLSPEDRLRGLSANEILKHLNPEEIARGLSAEERGMLKQLLLNLE